MSASPMTGGCLCGAVRFAAEPKENHIDACHCGMCRRWSGGPFMAVEVGPGLVFDDEARLGRYASSDHAERLFCTACGSVLAWRMRDGSLTAVSAQAFDDPSTFPLTTEIFVDHKPATYGFAGATRKMTEAQVMAAMGGANG